jgi:rhodanese-related sulfurtransferase
VSVPANADHELDPTEAERGAREEGWLIVDVREPQELVEDGRFPGALHVAMGRLNEEAESIPRDRPVVFACHSGARSGMAAEAFRLAGWDARNLAGGIEAWRAAGLPVER